jgi:hypothetical protein
MKNSSVLPIWVYVIIRGEILLCPGKICFGYERHALVVMEGPRKEEKVRSTVVCTVCGAKDWFPFKLCKQLVFNVAEKAVAYRLWEVTEPDVTDRGIIFEALHGKEKCVDNTSSKGQIPWFICQDILPASGGDEVRLNDELFKSCFSKVMHAPNPGKHTLNP